MVDMLLAVLCLVAAGAILVALTLVGMTLGIYRRERAAERERDRRGRAES
jgi:hypothetical protein